MTPRQEKALYGNPAFWDGAHSVAAAAYRQDGSPISERRSAMTAILAAWTRNGRPYERCPAWAVWCQDRERNIDFAPLSSWYTDDVSRPDPEG